MASLFLQIGADSSFLSMGLSPGVPQRPVDFGRAEFSGGNVDFSNARDWSSPPKFPGQTRRPQASSSRTPEEKLTRAAPPNSSSIGLTTAKAPIRSAASRVTAVAEVQALVDSLNPNFSHP